MAYRIAIASTDGIVVNQHFGHAERFHIIEIDDEKKTYDYIGTRESERVCQGHYHHDSSIFMPAGALSCTASLRYFSACSDAVYPQ